MAFIYERSKDLCPLTDTQMKRLRLEAKYIHSKRPHLYFSNGKWHIITPFTKSHPNIFSAQAKAVMFYQTVDWVNQKNKELL